MRGLSNPPASWPPNLLLGLSEGVKSSSAVLKQCLGSPSLSLSLSLSLLQHRQEEAQSAPSARERALVRESGQQRLQDEAGGRHTKEPQTLLPKQKLEPPASSLLRLMLALFALWQLIAARTTLPALAGAPTRQQVTNSSHCTVLPSSELACSMRLL